MFGCRPSGSFSFYLNIPRENITVNWVSDVQLDPVPNALGCVADSVNIVCQSNGVFSDEKGYISIYGENGTLRWRDKILNFPTLPLLDNYGDVTGSDGVSLVHYDLFGKLYPIIKCYGLRPMFSMQLVSNMYLLLVSEQGALVVRDLNAIPVATIFLNDTVQRANGTFLPISQPVVNGSRFYLLTEFVPEYETYDPTELNLQRLYAVDIHHRMADIMTVAWYFNFEMESNTASSSADMKRNKAPKREIKTVKRDNVIKTFRKNINSQQNLIWDDARNSVYVALPPPYASESSYNSFWGVSDKGNSSQLLFRSDDLQVTHMATFEADSYDDSEKAHFIEHSLWISTIYNTICAILPDGNVSKTIDLKEILKADVTITSKIALVQQNDTSETFLLFGVTITEETTEFRHIVRRFGIQGCVTSMLIALNTETLNGNIEWISPVPDNMSVIGQISGSRGADFQRKDQIVYYAEDIGKSAKIISIH